MNREEMIKIVAKAYAPSFQRRLEKMSDAQVAAIYNRHINKNSK